MSAIAGIFFFDGAPAEPGLIEKLTTAMKSRGPDEQTHWAKGSVALGHCMLRTTPESLEEHQPLMSQDKNLVLVWDGRLDNREELQREMKSAGAVLRDKSDAELVLQSFSLWGEDCPNKLLGDFAFAVWDENKKTVFCARDHVGARPFYFVRNNRYFAFASEDEPLLGLPGISKKPNEDRLATVLVPEFFICCEATQSWLEDVHKIGAGQFLIVQKQGSIKPCQYWRLEPGEEIRYARDEDYREAFQEIFGNSIRARMRTTGDVAAMMSGGLDSASIGTFVKRLLPEFPDKNFHTYSAIADEPEGCIESRCINILTRGMGDRAHFISVPSMTGMGTLKELLDIAWSRAQPVDNSILLQAMMCLSANRNGQKVLLHGATGDLATYFPTYYVVYYLLNGQWQWAWRECVGASENHPSLRDKSPLGILLRNLWMALPAGGLKSPVYRIHDALQRSVLSGSLISDEFAKRVGVLKRLREHQKAGRGEGLLSLQERQASTLFPQLLPNGLEGCERVAGRFGVELRDPWADRRVLEFFLRLPLQYKARDGWTKYLVRVSLANDLGPDIAWRKGKEHLGWNFSSRVVAESNDLMGSLGGGGIEPLGGYINRAAVYSRLRDCLARKKDDFEGSCFWMATLLLWLRRIQNV